MNNQDTTIPMVQPPISSSPGGQPQETLLMRGAFDPPATPGTLGRLDRFEILRLLGEGGMGQVYLAREPLTDTQVAIKIMRPQMADDPQAVHGFLTEARHMYRLSHPRILRVLEVSDRKEGPYYVMPHIAGGSLLGQYRPGEPMSTERTLSIARQVAEALAHAHAHGLIHRDIKPGNVLLDNDGNAYLTDFGLVRTVFNDSMVDASASHLEGTAPYMSPAVANGEAEDTRCDIYAFGALLYELLTGQPPYTGRTSQLILDQVLKGPPQPIRTVYPKASPAIVKIAEGCMARELRDRYASMADVVTDLDRASKGQAPFGALRRQRRRPIRLAALLGVLLLAGVFSLAPSLLKNRKENVTPPIPTSAPLQKKAALSEKGVGQHVNTASDQNMIQAERKAVTLTKPYPTSYKGATTDKIAVQYAVIELGKQAGLDYNWDESFRNTDPICREWVYPDIKSKPFRTAMKELLGPAGLTYELRENAIILKRDPESEKNMTGRGKEFGGRPTAVWDGATSLPYTYMTNNGAITITKYTGPGGAVAIPSMINGVPVTGIGDSSFLGCAGLTSVTISNGITTIGYHAFWGCTSLTNVTIPKSVTAIGVGLFNACHGLTSICVDEANTTYCSSSDGVLFDKAKTSLVSFPGGRDGSYKIPDSVKSISDAAFDSCARLTSVTIPNNITTIGVWAFGNCSSLMAVYFNGNAPSLDKDVFTRTDKATVYYRDGTKGWGNTFGGRPTEVWNQDIQIPFTFTTNNGAITITKYTGQGGAVAIPNEINGLPVTGIGDGAFMHRGDVNNLSIPNSVSNIVGYAFFGCSGLTNLVIPKSVMCMNGAAFAYCTKLLSIEVHPANPTYCSGADGVLFNKDKTRLVRYPGGKKGSYAIPRGVTIIGDFAFCGWSKLTELFVPQGVTDIGPYAVQCCDELTRVHLSDSLVRIGLAAFQECSSLTQVNIPKGVISIETYAFCNCRKLDSITVDDENAAYCSVDGALFDKTRTRLVSYPGGKTGCYTVSESVTELSPSAFYGCSYLPSVTLPVRVSRVGQEAFAQCNDLMAVYFKGNTPWVGADVFRENNKATVYYRPGTKGWGPTFGGRPTALWDEATPLPYTYTVANGAITITKYTGQGGYVAIPEKISDLPVTSIGDYAFADCPGLTSIMIPNGVISVSGGAFPFCDKLTSIGVDPANPAYCSEDGVLFNKAKTSLVIYPRGKAGSYLIPSSVTEIGFMSFWNSHKLTSVEMGNSVKRIACGAFGHCTGLTSVTIPDSVTDIEGEAFCKCRLADITIPKSVTSIEGNPFNGCAGLSIRVDAENPAYYSTADGIIFSKDMTCLVSYPSEKPGSYAVPNSVTNFGSAAFRDCTGLTLVTIPNNVTKINQFAFQGCTNLTSVNIPNSVTSIGRASFAGCSNLMGITLPDSITEIEAAAFEYCPNLSSVYFKGDAPNGGSDSSVFGGADKATAYYLPGTKGWGQTFGGRPTAVWNGKVQTGTAPEVTDLYPFTYKTNNGAITITKYTGPGGEVTIPSTINGLPVTGIGYDVFWMCDTATSVTIPASVNFIASNPFATHWDKRSRLLSFLVDAANTTFSSSPDGVLFNKDKTCLVSFPGGKAESYVIPNSVTEVTYYAFARCAKLTCVTIPSSVAHIRNYAFCGCAGLTNVYFKGNAPKLDKGVFEDSKVTICYLPGTTGWGKEFGGRPTSLWDGATPLPYTYTTNNGVITLTKYTGPGGDVTIPSTINGILVRSIGEAAFNGCVGLSSITTPNCIISIGACAFLGCSGLTKVVIPESVTSMAGSAFGDCGQLTSISIDAANPAYCSDTDGVVFSKDKTRLVCYPSGKAGAYAIPAGVSQIESGAFHSCRWLTSVTIPNGVTLIDGTTFPHCTSLVSVTIPDSVTSIGGCAFRGCTSLTSMVIPRGVTNIENWAFLDASKLTSVYFESNAPKFSGEPFFGVPNVTVYYRLGTKGWGPTFGGRPTAVWNPETPFTYTTNNGAITLTKYTGPGGEVSIPSTINGLPVSSIKDDAFGGCTNVTSMMIPAGVTSLGRNPFSNNWRKGGSLRSILVDDANPAYCCTSDGILLNKEKTILVSYPCGKAGACVIPKGVTSIRDFAFRGCVALTSVTIPNSVTNIGLGAFEDCVNLTSVAIPASVTSVGGSPFRGCVRLTSIVVDAANPACSGSADGVLFNKERTCLISYSGSKAGGYVIPDSVTTIGFEAFKFCTNLTSVTIPSSVTRLEPGAFMLCTSLTNVMIPSSVTSIGNCAFWGCNNISSMFFKGNAPSGDSDSTIFADVPNATIYYRPGTKGWGETFGGRPTKVWKE